MPVYDNHAVGDRFATRAAARVAFVHVERANAQPASGLLDDAHAPKS